MKEEIFHQAKFDSLATRLITPYSESYIYKGIKIEKTETDIAIYNTKILGDTYTEISDDQYEVFFNLGFRMGVYNLCIFNYNCSLNGIQSKIRTELTNRNNQKHYHSMKSQRSYIMNKYTEILKLN
jgi:uncharacterized protein with HEPN domain